MITELAKVFLDLTATAVAIRDSAADWETKFDLIFSDDISRKIHGTGIAFDWCDPDADYEDDVRAYVDALETKAEEISNAMVWT